MYLHIVEAEESQKCAKIPQINKSIVLLPLWLCLYNLYFVISHDDA